MSGFHIRPSLSFSHAPSSLVLSSGGFILHAIPKLRHTTTGCSVGLLVFFFLFLLSWQPSFHFFFSCSKGSQPWWPYLCALGASHLTRSRKAASFAEARAIRTPSAGSFGPPFERKPTAQKSFSRHVQNLNFSFCEVTYSCHIFPLWFGMRV